MSGFICGGGPLIFFKWESGELTKYRPANGSEGVDFFNRFCGHCQKDRAHRENPQGAAGCPILAATFVYEVEDPHYPAEWIWRQGDTLCTSYERERDDDQAPRCEKTIDMFATATAPGAAEAV